MTYLNTIFFNIKYVLGPSLSFGFLVVMILSSLVKTSPFALRTSGSYPATPSNRTSGRSSYLPKPNVASPTGDVAFITSQIVQIGKQRLARTRTELSKIDQRTSSLKCPNGVCILYGTSYMTHCSLYSTRTDRRAANLAGPLAGKPIHVTLHCLTVALQW